MDHGFRQRRPCRRRKLKCGRSGGISKYQCPRRIRLRIAGWNFFLRPCLERTRAAEDCIWIRTVSKCEKAAGVFGDNKELITDDAQKHWALPYVIYSVTRISTLR